MADQTASPAPHAGIRTSALLLLVLLSGCGGGGGADPSAFPPPTVSVAEVIAREVTRWDEFAGRIDAIETVAVRPRVAGYLEAVHFEEGAEVAAGDLLFTIDAREYEAAVASARANLERARTRLDVAAQELARSERLVAARAVSEEELTGRQGEAKQAAADVKAAQAQLAQAELQLEFTRITAPIDGRVGAARVRPGNLVSAGDPVLTTLVSLDPIYVTFEGDERIYLEYQSLARQGLRESSRDERNPVRVGLANETGFPHAGEMVFVDNAVDPATGTIMARAVLDNADRTFTPGLFARVKLLGSRPRPALLVHPQAILTDQDRKYLYVLGQGDIAQRRDVTLGARVDGLQIVEGGLAPGDRVVVNGTRRIFFPGMPVDPVPVPMDAPNSAAGGRSGGAPDGGPPETAAADAGS